jgi:hypothetical protein
MAARERRRPHDRRRRAASRLGRAACALCVLQQAEDNQEGGQLVGHTSSVALLLVVLLTGMSAVSAATRILDRLERVRETAPGRWLARCPAHPDRSPSLSVRELDDGRVLLHDFGGCDASAVLSALGLEMSDLFDKPLGNLRPSRSRIPARDLLEIISEETSVVAIVAADLIGKKAVTEADWQRLAKAASRIGAARDHARD